MTADIVIYMVDNQTGEILSETKRIQYVECRKKEIQKSINRWFESFMRGLDAGNNVNLVVAGSVYEYRDLFSDNDYPFLPNNNPCPF